MSGLSRTPGKRVWANTHRGFESRPLRQERMIGPSGALFAFWPALDGALPSAIHPPESAIRRAALVRHSRLLNTSIGALPSARLEPEMLRLRKGWMGLSLALGLLAGGMPAEASEVVKLARLVVSGKRGPNEAPRTTPPETRPAGAGPQAHGSGGNDDAGTAPAPSRGVS